MGPADGCRRSGRAGMERTVSVIIFLALAIVGAAIIFAFVAKSRVDPFCAQVPQCNGRGNGETFCADDGLSRCVIVDGCVRVQRQACACEVVDSIARCAP